MTKNRVFKYKYFVKVDNAGTFTNPEASEEGGLEWLQRYGTEKALVKNRFLVASVLQSFEYLISDAITAKEAVRRLRVLRNVRNGICKELKND